MIENTVMTIAANINLIFSVVDVFIIVKIIVQI